MASRKLVRVKLKQTNSIYYAERIDWTLFTLYIQYEFITNGNDNAYTLLNGIYQKRIKSWTRTTLNVKSKLAQVNYEPTNEKKITINAIRRAQRGKIHHRLCA